MTSFFSPSGILFIRRRCVCVCVCVIFFVDLLLMGDLFERTLRHGNVTSGWSTRQEKTGETATKRLLFFVFLLLFDFCFSKNCGSLAMCACANRFGRGGVLFTFSYAPHAPRAS